MSEYILEMKGIQKTYRSYGHDVYALTDGNLFVRPGSVHGLLGENGAGKSTLMKVLSGVESCEGGTITFEGKEITIKNSAAAAALGIGMVHQHFSLIEPYTVLQNVVLGREPANKIGIIDEKTTREKVKAVMQEVGFDMPLDAKVSSLSMGEKQKVEILRVLYNDPKLLIFDEPTSVLVEQEIAQLMDTISMLSRQGRTIIYISHKVEEVMNVTDEVTVLRNGVTVENGVTSELNADNIVEMMVGKRVEADMKRADIERGEVVLSVKDLEVEGMGASAVKKVSFELNSGMILAVAGINGNGQQEMVDAIFGLKTPSGGQVILNGRDVTKMTALQHRKAGIGYIPEDRVHVGSCATATIAENEIVATLDDPEISKGGWLNWKSIQKLTMDRIHKYGIKAPGGGTYVGELSGGHIQRTILARELSKNPSVLLACETTMGLDVESVHYIHDTLTDMRNRGCGILLVSSDINEILGLADEIIVIHEGRLTAHLTNGPEVTKSMIGAYMLGIKNQFEEVEA